MWHHYHTPQNLDEALAVLEDHRGRARIVAGATDLILEIERGIRTGIDHLIDITRIPGLDRIQVGEDDRVHLGPLVTHNHCAGNPLIIDRAFALARACWEVGAPQIRNRGTVAGNLITASPANDSITPLMALGAVVTLRSVSGEREVPLSDFYKGVRETVMGDGEIMTDIAFPLPPGSTRSTFIKLGLRRAQAISVVDVAVSLDMEGNRVRRAAVTLGAVAPTIIHAEKAELYLEGEDLTAEVIERAGKFAAEAAVPIDDLRGTAEYRRWMVEACTARALRQVAAGEEKVDYPDPPVMLWGAQEWHWERELDASFSHHGDEPIQTTINGNPFIFKTGHDKTLLRLLREEGQLVGTKEGCAEGECGACTVILDGLAVMSCMVPAPRAHQADILTIEGLASESGLHPVQQGFIETGAVQCGYCTPGFIMSGAMLLKERPDPTLFEIQQSITGNLCRCTGYYSILKAIERAAQLAAGGQPQS